MVRGLDGQIAAAVAVLAARRHALGLSPGDVDARAGFTPGKVARWEDCCGPRTAWLLARWAAALGLVLTARGPGDV